MEKIYQAVGADGLQIPTALMRQYGLVQGSGVLIEFESDGIRIVPARPDRTTIENRALRYLLSTVGDGVRVEARPLPNEAGWQVNVLGSSPERPAGTLIYSSSGVLQADRSTPPPEIRRIAQEA